MANKKKRTKSHREHSVRAQDAQAFDVPMWHEGAEFHALVPGRRPTPEQLEEATKKYQQNIRNSPLWDQMVAKFGLKKAKELLREFKVEVR